jgi:hypothetical protein
LQELGRFHGFPLSRDPLPRNSIVGVFGKRRRRQGDSRMRQGEFCSLEWPCQQK